MQATKQKQLVVKSWYVVALPDDTPADGVARARPRKCSSDFVVRDAAEEYAALMRKWSKFPDSVMVRARQGYDDL